MERPVDGKEEFDTGIVTELFHRYAPSLFAYFRQHTDSREDAEDLLHEVFAAVLEQPEFGLLNDAEQALWLWRVARNKTIDPISRQTERISPMHHTLDTHTTRKSSKRWRQPALLAAVLFLALLVSGLLTALGVIHVGQPSPTASVASQAITSVALSDNTNLTTQASTVQHFAVGQAVWLVLNVGKVKGHGDIITIKWYENGRLYATTRHGIQAPEGKQLPRQSKSSLYAHIRSLHSQEMGKWRCTGTANW